MPKLALGTVQFGLAYGLTGRSHPVAEDEARRVLRRAYELGITRLDTAPGYGDIERRLLALCGDLPFEIVSKIPSLPCTDTGSRSQFIRETVTTSRARLGDGLCGILFHTENDLFSEDADLIWQALCDAGSSGLALGASCYGPSSLEAIAARFPVAMAQLPANALDQRLLETSLSDRIEVTVRSAFLQGLLLMPLEQAIAQVPQAEVPLRAWHTFCADRNVSAVEAALSVVKGLPHVGYCVIGVDDVRQLEQVAQAWEQAKPVSAESLRCSDPAVIDPRQWSLH